jgi:Tol biopolymer transport system component
MQIGKKCSIVMFTLISFLACGQNGGQDRQPEEKTLNPDPPSFAGRIVFQSNADGDNEIFVLTQGGVRQLTDNSWEDEYPVWSPHGNTIAFSSNREGDYDIFLMQADGTKVTTVASTDADEREPAWYPDGRGLAFSVESKKLLRTSIAIHRTDLRTGRIRRIIPRYSRSHGIPHISPSTTLMVFTGKRTFGWDVAAYDWSSNQVRFLVEGGKSCRARFSPSGQKLAYVSSSADGKGDIWMMDFDGGRQIRLTHRDQTHDYFPDWSPDGRFLVFNSSRQHDHGGDWQLYLYDIENKTATLLYDSPGNDIFPDWGTLPKVPP